MQAEQNELITRIGPGTPCGALMRSYWQPVALVDEFDPRARPAHGRAPGEGGAPARPGPGAVSRRPGPLGPARPRLPAPRRRPGLRPPRGRRPALPVPRLEVRRRRRAASRRRPSRPARRCARGAPAQLSGAGALGRRSSPGSGPRARRRRRCRRSTAFVAPASHSFAFKGLWHCNWLQAFEVGIDPAHPSFLHRYLRTSLAGSRLRPAVPRRQRRRGRRRALADDARDARVLPARDPLRERRRRAAAADDAAADDRRAHARARHARRLPAHLRDPAVGDDHDHADARAGRRHAHLLVFSFFTSFDAPLDKETMRAQRLRLRLAARLRAAQGPAQPLGLRPRGAAHAAPTSAWARKTSTCTTSGRWRAWARSRTARASTWAPATR